ncbi:hypothetical protein RG47T_1700 [Mucilaginibacter polytrichastri]|uniref:Uncharacterized protein n=1 Tax=Mucilaginibacter polytrichastri TaxID=1302689 RepID=A0A1Q5ZWZ9_9SPHI|nr:hypothetical protein RG47T_1700 [Mucilaginibacter polytrichastri]
MSEFVDVNWQSPSLNHKKFLSKIDLLTQVHERPLLQG